MIRIKICGITRVLDAQAAVAAGADALGLVFAPSRRRVKIAQAQSILKAIPPTVLRVGVFVDQDPAWIKSLIEKLGLDRIQFHGNETNQVLRQFSGQRAIRALRPQPNTPLPKKDPAPAAAAFLVDAFSASRAGGTGKLSNWAYARKLKKFGKPIILSGGLNPENVRQALTQVNPDMVDVSSGVETRPGIKSSAKIKAFIQQVRKTSK